MFIIVVVIVFGLLIYNKLIQPSAFINDAQPLLKGLIEKDYEFLLKLKYGVDVDVEEKFNERIRSGLIGMVVAFGLIMLLYDMSFLFLLLSFVVGVVFFKMQYSNLRSFYKANLHKINLLLPYYLKSLEILVQHYTVPVALSRSIETAPEVFRPGLRTLVSKIEAGDMTVDPYMDFAKEYPVRDSMRMMRLLYRLSLGSQEKKHEQLMMFSRTVSNLQNKAREQKYAERLGKMEQKTMIMLFATGGGVMALMLLSMMMMMNY